MLPTRIPHRRLRNESGRILREAERGRRFVVTVDGRPVASLGPVEPEAFVPIARARELLARARVDTAFLRDAKRLSRREAVMRDPWIR